MQWHNNYNKTKDKEKKNDVGERRKKLNEKQIMSKKIKNQPQIESKSVENEM